nr:hypothetical protein [Microbacterium yannicii]
MDAVLAANGLDRSSIIYPGQTLAVPGAASAPAAAPAPAPAPLLPPSAAPTRSPRATPSARSRLGTG